MHIALILLLIWKIVGKTVKQILNSIVDNELFLVLQGYKVLEKKLEHAKQCH